MSDLKLLECFDNPVPPEPPAHPPEGPAKAATETGYVIEHVADEFTSLCPKTGHPDFGRVILRYCPDRLCVELKSLKLYLQAFRSQGIFYEAVTNKIARDLFAVMQPRWLVLETRWRGRGGIRSRIRVALGDVPAGC